MSLRETAGYGYEVGAQGWLGGVGASVVSRLSIIKVLRNKAYFFIFVAYGDVAGNSQETEGCSMYSIPSEVFMDMPEKKKCE